MLPPRRLPEASFLRAPHPGMLSWARGHTWALQGGRAFLSCGIVMVSTELFMFSFGSSLSFRVPLSRKLETRAGQDSGC